MGDAMGTAAVALAYQDEIAKLKMQLVTYRYALERAGVEPPDMEGADLLQMWRDCRAVIRAAQECVANLGTSKELLSDRWKSASASSPCCSQPSCSC
jgi:hypothetical protein